MKKVAFHTLGCKVNQYETEAMTELMIESGYEVAEFNQFADIYIINTCTVTNVAAKKSRQMITRARKLNPNGIIAVVGCYAQNEPEKVQSIEGVDLIIGTKDRKNIVSYLSDYEKNHKLINVVSDIKKEKTFETLEIQANHGKTRAYIKIQDGCNQFCSYCIIPHTRGPIRSRKPEDIYREIVKIAEHGYKEVVLTGIHIGSYGKDLKNAELIEIIEHIEKIDGIERIRLGSLEPTMITKEFVDRASRLTKLCPHFHLSLQSGCDRTLKQMNRKYTTADFRTAAHLLREKFENVALTTDIIVGFPGETEKDAMDSLEFVEEMAFSEIHVFKYSKRDGTPAADRKDQVQGHLKDERSHRMIALGQKMQKAFLESLINHNFDVLIEQNIKDDTFEGYTQNYVKVYVTSNEISKNQVVKVVLNELEIKEEGCVFNGEIVKGD